MPDHKRFSVIESSSVREQSLEERLKDLPELRASIERMLEVVENSAGDMEKAATAEEHVTEELRQMGNEVLHGWAQRQEQKKEEKYNDKKGVNRKGKKTLLVHPIWKNRNSRTSLYPGAWQSGDSAIFGISRGDLTHLLDTIAADDHRFCCRWSIWLGAAAKLEEHYRIEVSATVVRAIAEKHGEAMARMERRQQSDLPDWPGVSVLIVETDGSMIPVVETAEPAVPGEPLIDRRTPTPIRDIQTIVRDTSTIVKDTSTIVEDSQTPVRIIPTTVKDSQTTVGDL
jgi:hypothetical protein